MEKGIIEGTVTDESGDPLPGVIVIAESSSMQGNRTTVTNAEDRFRFLDLMPGSYKLTAELEGFQTAEEHVPLRLGDTVNVNITLQVAIED